MFIVFLVSTRVVKIQVPVDSKMCGYMQGVPYIYIHVYIYICIYIYRDILCHMLGVATSDPSGQATKTLKGRRTVGSPTYPSIYLFTYLYICLFIYTYIYLSTYLSI